MKKLLAISVLLAVGFMSGVSWKEITAHAAGGGGVPKGNGDVNGDGTIDITDGIYLLGWLFTGGEAPVAIEGGDPQCQADLEAANLEKEILDGQVKLLQLELGRWQSDLRLAATGQTKCYDTAGAEIPCEDLDHPGQDGFYQEGYPSEGRFVVDERGTPDDRGDDTVTDKFTGLEWQRATADVNGDGTTDGDGLDWRGALQYCEGLDFAGHTDWRLPNVQELLSIVDYSRHSPAIDPMFDAETDVYWTSSTNGRTETHAWRVYFLFGEAASPDPKTASRYVRAVRGPDSSNAAKFESLGKNDQGCFEYRHETTGITFVLLQGGKSDIGAQKTNPEGENYDPDAEDDEKPVHEVTLTPFLIAKYEVTQAQWMEEMGSNPSFFPGDDDRPVEQVSWNDIQMFESKTGLTLPTEAQWEYACRAGESGPFAGPGNLGEMGWYSDNAEGTTHPVGQKQPNGFGLHDMHGNVLEWCEDLYDQGFYGKQEALEDDPCSKTSSEPSESRVCRGGNWAVFPANCRSARRGKQDPSATDNMRLGFRPVCTSFSLLP